MEASPACWIHARSTVASSAREVSDLLYNRSGLLGVSGVTDVRQGKYIEVDLNETSEAAARVTVERICKDLLANTVIENYAYELIA